MDIRQMLMQAFSGGRMPFGKFGPKQPGRSAVPDFVSDGNARPEFKPLEGGRRPFYRKKDGESGDDDSKPGGPRDYLRKKMFQKFTSGGPSVAGRMLGGNLASRLGPKGGY